jgi:hypothetical protein
MKPVTAIMLCRRKTYGGEALWVVKARRLHMLLTAYTAMECNHYPKSHVTLMEPLLYDTKQAMNMLYAARGYHTPAV